MREVKVKPVLPIYMIGAVWLLYITKFPLYEPIHFLIVGGISIGVYVLLSLILPKKTVMVEEKLSPIRTGDQDLDEILNQGVAFRQELRRIKGVIKNPGMIKQIAHLEQLSKEIFDFIQKNPQKLRQIRQFTNYYLPTTVKLLKNYEEFSKQDTKVHNIAQSMAKIEGMMNNIVKVFKGVLNDLFEDKAMDTSVDLEVLENMMKQEGFDRELKL